MASDSAPQRKRVYRRPWFVATLLAVLSVATALVTGLPQRIALEYGLRRALGANVHVAGLSLLPDLRVRELVISDESPNPPVVLHGIDIFYDLSFDSIVTVSSFYVESVALDLRRSPDGTSNYAFVERFLRGTPDSEEEDTAPRDITPYIPQSVRVGSIALSLDSPDGRVALEGLRLEADLESLLKMNARLLGTDLRGSLGGGALGDERPITGSVDIQYLRNMASSGMTASVALDEVVTVEATLQMITAVGTTAAQLHIEEGRFLDDRFAVLAPGPLHFESLDLSGTKVTLAIPPGVPWNVEADIHIAGKQIRYGDPDHEWYDGDLAVSGTYDGDQGDLEATLNNGQRLSVLVNGEVKDIHVAATLVEWDRADLSDALPKDFRPVLDELPHLNQIAASAEVRTQWPAYEVNASIDPLFTPQAGEGERFALRIVGNGTVGVPAEELFHGMLEATLGEGELTASIDADSASRYSGDIVVAAIDMARWLTPVQQRIPIAPPPGVLSGSLHIENDAGFSAKGDVSLDSTDLDLSMTFDALSELPESILPLAGSAKVVLPNGEPQGTAEADFRYGADRLSFASKLSNVDLAAAVSLVKRDLVPVGVEATVTGSAEFTRDSRTTSISLNVDAAPATLAGFSVPAEQPLHLEGTLNGSAALTELHADDLALRLTDDATLNLADFTLSFSPFAAKGHLTGRVDFDYVGPTIGLPAVVGALAVDAPFSYTDGIVSGPVRLEGDGFGYGKWAGPYGTPVIVTGDARYALETRSLGMDDVEVLWGEVTRVTSPRIDATLSPFSLAGPFEATTDLSPLVDLRFLDAADGTATVTGTLGFGNHASTRVEYEVAAQSLTLSGAIAAFGGLASSGNLVYGESLDGRIQFAAAQAAAAGAVLQNPRGVCMIENGVANASGAEASVYGGRTFFDAQVNVLNLDEGGRLNANLRDVDLDRFTKEYEPPSVVLTGIANGDVTMAWNGEGLHDLRVDLASEEGFSLNREIIENLLLQSVTSDVTGLKRLNKRIREDTIGEGAQRPFDRASVTLSLEGDTYEEQRLVGPVSLKSEMLNLSIDLGVDLLAIASAMELQQQAQLGEGDTISAEPVQWELPGESSNSNSNNADDASSSTAKEEES